MNERISAADRSFAEWVDAYNRGGFGKLAKVGAEYHGPCPICGGRDRFHIYEKNGRTLAGCRKGGCQFRDLATALFPDDGNGSPVYASPRAARPKRKASTLKDWRRIASRNPWPGNVLEDVRGSLRPIQADAWAAAQASELERLNVPAGDKDHPRYLEALTVAALSVLTSAPFKLPADTDPSTLKVELHEKQARHLATFAHFAPSLEPVDGELFHPRRRRLPAASWHVRDQDGRLFAVHCRFPKDDGGKDVLWWRRQSPDQHPGSCWSLKKSGGFSPVQAPLYGSEHLPTFDRSRPVIVVEGEKTTDKLRAIPGVQVLGTTCGAGSTPAAAVLDVLSDFDLVVFWPDYDPLDPRLKRRAGQWHMEKARAALKRGRILDPAAAGLNDDGSDAAEWLEARQDNTPAELAAELQAWIDATQEPEAPKPPAKKTRARKTKEPPPGLPALQSFEPGHEEYFTESANADRFVDLHAKNYRWNKTASKTGEWMRWDARKGHWKEDDLDRARDVVKQTNRLIFQDARNVLDGINADTSDEERAARKSFADVLKSWGRKGLSATGVRAATYLASSDPRAAVSWKDFDQDHHLLGFRNGVLNLETDEFTPHSEDYRPMISKAVGIDYDPNAGESEPFLRFLRSSCVDPETGEPDQEYAAYILRALGYSLTGSVKLHVMFLAHGPGGNGKSVLIRTLNKILGEDLCATMPFSAFLASKFDDGKGANPEILNLRGARLAIASESRIGGRFDEALVKGITGGDPINARRLYGNPERFDPTHTLWLFTNHAPDSYDHSAGWWRRVKLLPFPKKFVPPDEYDPTDPLNAP